MAGWIIGLLVAVSAGTWIYNKFMHTTGNNTKTSVIAAAASGLLLFFFTLIVLGIINNIIGQ